MGTGSFPGVKSGQGVTLTPHPLLVPWSRKSRAIPLLPLWAVQLVQSLRACTRAHVTFTLPLGSYTVNNKRTFFPTFRRDVSLFIFSHPRHLNIHTNKSHLHRRRRQKVHPKQHHLSNSHFKNVKVSNIWQYSAWIYFLYHRLIKQYLYYLYFLTI